ncbi:LysM peptidoglycan-binding domain-containing protein [Carboxydochorda subterranea]|uniref:LysM peptidoglycan-binding domain-containing protein n=1 Tax=Carboxydichorda subterranea TaxID=3109565 RepID=A0ABZ1C124_9FIRM|nr:LysM peptidoglycan-binding domain-containing protein [Limnochorda sp. L945t]WRP18777.1 LysM peptidoglycan-binding domain-containing protein [Limnochorda sp. L945t]
MNNSQSQSVQSTGSGCPDRPFCRPGCHGGVYTVQPGDTMFLIAQRFGVSLNALIACNPQIPDPSRIFPGQRLCLPGVAPPPPFCGPGCQGGVYTVQPGDTMFLIAQRFGVSLNALIACNPQIPNPSLIFPGQQLCLPGVAPPPPFCGPGCQGGVYTVQPGDTMFLIAQRLGVSLNALIACNPQIPDPSLIFPGQQLCIPGGPPPTQCGPGCRGGIYTVQPGDTMFFIAQRFGVSLNALIACNPQIPDPSLIFPGQQLCIPG